MKYSPVNYSVIQSSWNRRTRDIRALQLKAREQGDKELDNRLGAIYFRYGRRLQDLEQMKIDHDLHNETYIPNPVDWNCGQPTKVSTHMRIHATSE